MSVSRATFATTEAAATDAQSRSAPTSVRWWMPSSGSDTASSSSASGRTGRRAAASWLASSVAWRMLIRSIRSELTNATAQATAFARISRSNRRRSSGFSIFESRSPRGSQSGGRITAAAATGPARQPRPTSSIPATWRKPRDHRIRSSAKSGSRRSECQRATSNRPPGLPGAKTVGPRRVADGERAGSSIRRLERLAAAMWLLRLVLALDAALAQRGRLADALAQEVELGAAGLAVAHDFDLLDARAVHLEGALDADAAGDPPDGDRAGDAATAKPHDGAFEDLDALAVSFHDAGRHLNSVSRAEFRKVGPELVLDDLVEYVHDRSLLLVPAERLRSVFRDRSLGCDEGVSGKAAWATDRK